MNRLGLAPLIAQRLRDMLPPEVHVLSSADAPQALQGTAPMPHVLLYFAGERVVQLAQSGKHSRDAQSWAVVIGVRNVRNSKNGMDAMQEAGELAALVDQALMGWKADMASKPLMKTTPPRPSYSAGVFFYPRVFETEIVSKV